MRLLLDEMITATVAEQLRDRGHDVVAVQDASMQHLVRQQHHFGLLLFTNDTFPRHLHDAFVGALVTGLADVLAAHPGDDDSSWIRWLTSPR